MTAIAPRNYGLSWRGLLLRSLAPTLIFWLGFIAFAAGAGVSERAVPASPLHWLYYTLGLFVLGGLDLGTPHSGSAWAQNLLWFVYFAAPLVTASALVEALWVIALPMTYRLRRLRDHTVIVGCGHLAELYLQKLRTLSPRSQIVIVERDAASPRLLSLTAKYPVTVIQGDINRALPLTLLQLAHARRVLLLTGSDFTNLNAASRILERTPALAGQVVVHLSNLGLLQTVDLARAVRESAFFNSHAIAARQLVQDHLLSRFEQTACPDLVVLAGFGRFGQSVLQSLQQQASGRFSAVILLDRQPHAKVSAFADRVGFDPSYRRHTVTGHVLDCSLWLELEQTHQVGQHQPLIVVGTDDDMVNLEAALWLRKRFPDAFIVARQLERSSFAVELARKADILLFAVAELVIAAMPDHWCTVAENDRSLS